MALTGAGIEAAQLEARELICAAAGKTAEELYRDISLYTTDEIAVQTEALLARRLAGEPIAYLIGEWSFCGLPFYVSPEALIPRVDTEMLAQLAMNRLHHLIAAVLFQASGQGGLKVLPLGSGRHGGLGVKYRLDELLMALGRVFCVAQRPVQVGRPVIKGGK